MIHLVNKGYKFRTYPNIKQQESIAKMFGCCRYVYNTFLAKAKSDYEATGKSNSVYDNQKELTVLKKEPDLAWLKEADSQALNQSLVDLGDAYFRFFRNQSRYPKFKKKCNAQSYTTCVTSNAQLQISDNRIYVPKVGWIKIKQHRAIDGRVTGGTISRTSSGKYFIALRCKECPVEEIDKVNSDIGIDLGIKSFIVSDSGQCIDSPKNLANMLPRLKYHQTKLSKKQRGSKNYEKQRIKVAKLHEKIANQRKDFLHKTSIQIIKNYDLIAVEDLDVKEMLESATDTSCNSQLHAFKRNISDVSWSEFLRQLEYKSKWYDRKFVQVDRYFPSSQLCSCCGYKNVAVKNLDIRKWTCPKCGSTHDRDQNAAKNILAEAYRLTI